MKDLVYVTGHKNPDSDSICSAFSYSEFKKKTTNQKAGKRNSTQQFWLVVYPIFFLKKHPVVRLERVILPFKTLGRFSCFFI